MNVVRKDASITNTGSDDDFPGTFEVILSTPALDRDGDELKSEDWEQPLPSHITFDIDHGMNVASTVGSGVPAINDAGQLVVAGSYSSLPRAQDTRTLVREGHIRTTSVAFMTKKVAKDGRTRVVRELLNGAFVAIPSNREAVVLASKSVKAGARNSVKDTEHIQAIHDHAIALGAVSPAAAGDADMAAGKSIGVKTVAGSYEQRQQAVSDALDALYRADDGDGDDDRYVYAYPLATFDDSVVYRVGGSVDENGQWQASYTIGADGVVVLGPPQRVNMVETIEPVNGSVPKGFRLIPDAPTAVGKSLDEADVTSAEDAAADPAAAASADAAAAGEAAATEADASEIHTRAARIRVMAALASLEGDTE